MPKRVVTGVAYLPWLALLGWFSSVAWFLCDDAFISFRYASNLVEGNGLVFNPGEYVEGYTNFLWVLELAAIWAVFDAPPYQVAPWLSVGYTIATIAAMLWWIARLPSLGNRRLVGWMALGLVCSSATIAVWTSAGGLETRQFTFFIVAAVVLLTVHGKRSWALVLASLSLAGAELTRPEGLLLAVCCIGWYAVQRLVREGKISAALVREILLLAGPFAAVAAAHYLFRYAYYGEWLPNTYYAKHIQPWYESGFRYLWSAALETGLYLLVPLAYVALRVRWRLYGDISFALVLLLVAAHMAYLMPVGGDHFEYRPLDFYWPLLALPAATGIVHLGSRVAEAAGRLPQVPNGLNRVEVYAIVIFLPTLFYANSIQGVLLFKNAAIGEYIHKMHTELNEEDAAWLLAAPGMQALVAISNDLRSVSANDLVGLRFSEHREMAARAVRYWDPGGETESGTVPEGAVAASGGIRKLYFLPALEVDDNDGLGESEERKSEVYAARLGPDRWMPFTTDDPDVILEFLLQPAPASRLGWMFTQPHRKRTIDYDGGISLLDASFAAPQPLSVMLTWKAAPGLVADFSTSLRLYNLDGKEAWARDSDLLALFTGGMRHTRDWPPDAPIRTLSLFDIPPDIPSGQYELRLIVYHADTLKPTVVAGIWEPEIVLAHVQVQ